MSAQPTTQPTHPPTHAPTHACPPAAAHTAAAALLATELRHGCAAATAAASGQAGGRGAPPRPCSPAPPSAARACELSSALHGTGEGDAEAQRHDLRCSQRLRDPHVGRERRDLAVTRLLKHEHGVAQGVEQGGRQGLE